MWPGRRAAGWSSCSCNPFEGKRSRTRSCSCSLERALISIDWCLEKLNIPIQSRSWFTASEKGQGQVQAGRAGERGGRAWDRRAGADMAYMGGEVQAPALGQTLFARLLTDSTWNHSPPVTQDLLEELHGMSGRGWRLQMAGRVGAL